MNKINEILELARKLPSGLNDPEAAEKLLREKTELVEAMENGDTAGALTEVADAGYYAIKHLDWVAKQMDLSIEDILILMITKYKLRARSNNPKDDKAERAACMAIYKWLY